MPADTALSRVTKSDFFAILGSGTYVVASFGVLVFALWNHGQNSTASQTVEGLSESIEKHWPIAVALFFLAFLVGNALRALPVNLVDNWSRIWFGWLIKKKEEAKANEEKNKYYSALWNSSFPYGEMLQLELEALILNKPNLDFSIPPEGTRHSMYNFWKAEICRESSAAFEYTQELEGRVRLFATMFWAAALGLIAGVIGLFLCAITIIDLAWLRLIASLLIVSILIGLVFGSQIRRVRGQEVASVFSAYISLLIKRSTAAK